MVVLFARLLSGIHRLLLNGLNDRHILTARSPSVIPCFVQAHYEVLGLLFGIEPLEMVARPIRVEGSVLALLVVVGCVLGFHGNALFIVVLLLRLRATAYSRPLSAITSHRLAEVLIPLVAARPFADSVITLPVADPRGAPFFITKSTPAARSAFCTAVV